jgi:hypothetical protein
MVDIELGAVHIVQDSENVSLELSQILLGFVFFDYFREIEIRIEN